MAIITVGGSVTDVLGSSATYSVTATQATAWQDGSASAPAGPIQFPNLFANYATRPPWNVAGVDYYVGIDRNKYPTNASLKDPATINIAGVSVIAGSPGTIQLNGANITLDGYDFSRGNGWGLSGRNASGNLTITNCRFSGPGFNPAVPNFIDLYESDTYTTMMNCECTDPTGVAGDNVIWVGKRGGTFWYNWLHVIFQDGIKLPSGASVGLDVRYNLFTDFDQAPNDTGVHSDCVQAYTGGTLTNRPIVKSTLYFNTHYQPATGEIRQNGTMNSAVRLGDQNGSLYEDPDIACCVIIARGNNHGVFTTAMGEAFQIDGNSGPTTNLKAHHCYWDTDGIQSMGENVNTHHIGSLQNPMFFNHIRLSDGAVIGNSAFSNPPSPFGQNNVPGQPSAPMLTNATVSNGQITASGTSPSAGIVTLRAAVFDHGAWIGAMGRDNAGMLGFVTVAAGGNWTITSNAMPSGTYSIYATVTEQVAFNGSLPSTTINVTV